MSPPIGSVGRSVRGRRLPDAIPDSGLLHRYDWSHDSTTTSTVPDLQGSEDLTGSFTDLNGSINGIQAGTFDGTDDTLDVDFATTVTQPFEVFSVSDSSDDGTDQDVFDAFKSNVIARRRFDSDEYQFFAGTGVNGSIPTTTPEIHTGVYNGVDSLLRESGTEILSGDVGTNDLDGLTAGSRRADVGNGNWFNGTIGEILIYDPSESGYSRSDVETYLSDKWGIEI